MSKIKVRRVRSCRVACRVWRMSYVSSLVGDGSGALEHVFLHVTARKCGKRLITARLSVRERIRLESLRTLRVEMFGFK